MKRKIALAALFASTLVVPMATSHVQAVVADDGMPAQDSLDLTAEASTYAGLWGDAPGGVNARPYVQKLSVINAGVETPIITAGTPTDPIPAIGSLAVSIAPYNLCKKVGGNNGQCYPSPNRLGMTIGYVRMRGNGPGQYGQLGYNFSNPAVPLLQTVNENTIIDITLAMNTWGKQLRWTWMNGVPTYWQITDLGTEKAVVHLKFKLSTAPNMYCSTAVPVGPCNPADYEKNYPTAPRPITVTKILRTDFIFSMDETGVEPMFSGTLFSSVNADLGSLEAVPSNSPTLGLTYGIIGASEIGGLPNSASFYAVVSDQSLLNYFGATPEAVAAPEFADTLAVQRKDGGGQGTAVWTRWNAATNGLDGWFLSVTDVKFDGKAVAASSVSAQALTTTQPAKFGVRPGGANSVKITRRSATQQSLSLSATTKACSKKSCRWVISKAASTFDKTAQKLKTIASRSTATRTSASGVINAKKGDRISAMLQVKSGSKWVYVTSRLVVAK